MAAGFRCRCTVTHCCGQCHNRATQEDMVCDLCRGPAGQIEHMLHYILKRYGPGR